MSSFTDGRAGLEGEPNASARLVVAIVIPCARGERGGLSSSSRYLGGEGGSEKGIGPDGSLMTVLCGGSSGVSCV